MKKASIETVAEAARQEMRGVIETEKRREIIGSSNPLERATHNLYIMNGWTKDGSSVREYFERSQFGVIIYKPLTWYLLDLVDNNGHMVRHEHAIWFTGQGIREAAIPFTPESLIERWDTGDRRVVNGLAKINRNKAAGKILLAI